MSEDDDTRQPTEAEVLALGLDSLRKYHPTMAAEIERDEPELIVEIETNRR